MALTETQVEDKIEVVGDHKACASTNSHCDS